MPLAVAEIESLRRQLAEAPVAGALASTVREDDLCYTVFTSGTTGIPKAVAITHRSWANLIDWHVREYRLDQEASGILVSAFGFDISQRSLITPLYCGAAISLTISSVFDGYEIVDIIERHRIRSIHLAPSSLYLIIQAGQDGDRLATLRHLFIGGETLATARVMDWARKKAPHATSSTSTALLNARMLRRLTPCLTTRPIWPRAFLWAVPSAIAA